MAGADASLPLQIAVVAALKGNSAVQAIVSDRVFDRVPKDAVKPYISIGPSQVTPELADEYDASRERFQVDGWSSDPGRRQIKTLGAVIRAALHGAALTLEGDQRLVFLEIEQTQYLPDPDGLTLHAAVVFTAGTEPSA